MLMEYSYKDVLMSKNGDGSVTRGILLMGMEREKKM
jgi:hypothetical protein